MPDELLTVAEVAAILRVSDDTVTRRFAKVKGVIDLGSPETPKRRRYRVLRIQRRLSRNSSSAGAEISASKSSDRSSPSVRLILDLREGNEGGRCSSKVAVPYSAIVSLRVEPSAKKSAFGFQRTAQ